jgi:hypothetical protein
MPKAAKHQQGVQRRRSPTLTQERVEGIGAVSCSSRHQKTVRLRKNAVYHLLRWLSEGERGWPRCM